MTSTENERIKRLEKRMNYLNGRIYEAGDKDLSFDKAEASALEWAINLLEVHLKVKEGECQHQWRFIKQIQIGTAGLGHVDDANQFYCVKCLDYIEK